MSSGMFIFIYVVTIMLVVVVHEAGHFTMAKIFRIKVEEFFVGFGPRIWSFRRGETEYGVKALPLGGYVRIAGMNPFQEISPEELPRTYGAKPPWQRALVIAAGPVTHFAIALLVLAIYFAAIGAPKTFRPQITGVGATLDGKPSPGAVAGLRPGDVVTAMDAVRHPTEDQFRAYIHSHAGRAVRLTVLRDGRTVTLEATPALARCGDVTAGCLGILVEGGPVLTRDRPGLITGVGRAAITVGSMVKAVIESLGHVFGPSGLGRIWDLLRGAPRKTTDVGSVVGGYRLATQATQAGRWDLLFSLFAGFNVFVGILNFLPLPPLDGGHIAVLVAEKVTRRKVDVRRLIPLTALITGFMVILMVSLIYLDVVNPIPNPFH